MPKNPQHRKAKRKRKMSKNLKKMVVRATTGIVYVALLVGCILSGPVGCLMFFATVAAATVWEFSSLMNRHMGTDINRPIVAISAVLLNLVLWSRQWDTTNSSLWLVLYSFTLFFLVISELYRKSENPLGNWVYSLASQLYIALPFALVHVMTIDTTVDYYSLPQYTWVVVLALFVFLWANDTGAYLAGSALHKIFPAKLFPRISPNKSWVGSIGGGLLTLGVSLIFAHLEPRMTIIGWMGMALLVVVAATWGDLVESLLKRQLGIKDSGNILPGHGGLLDRFDSALLSIPATATYYLLIS